MVLQEIWKSLVQGLGLKSFVFILFIFFCFVIEDDLKLFYEVMKMNNVLMVVVELNVGMKWKGGFVGGLDIQ